MPNTDTIDIADRVTHAIRAFDAGDTDAYRAALDAMEDDGWYTAADLVRQTLLSDDDPLTDAPDDYYPRPTTISTYDLCTFDGEPPF